jgi:hypothetical protein
MMQGPRENSYVFDIEANVIISYKYKRGAIKVAPLLYFYQAILVDGLALISLQLTE